MSSENLANCTANSDTAIFHTKQWLTQSVIKHQFCPYAKQPHEHHLIGYTVYSGNHVVELLEQLAVCCIALDKQQPTSLETTLLIVSDSQFLADFYEYLDVLDAANALLEKPRKLMLRFSDDFQQHHADDVPKTWSTDYQIASFHPEYVFDGSHEDDRENYTNRSPYPVFHLLRNSSIDAVRMDDARADKIVARNIATLSRMTADEFHQLQVMSRREG